MDAAGAGFFECTVCTCGFRSGFSAWIWRIIEVALGLYAASRAGDGPHLLGRIPVALAGLAAFGSQQHGVNPHPSHGLGRATRIQRMGYAPPGLVQHATARLGGRVQIDVVLDRIGRGLICATPTALTRTNLEGGQAQVVAAANLFGRGPGQIVISGPVPDDVRADTPGRRGGCGFWRGIGHANRLTRRCVRIGRASFTPGGSAPASAQAPASRARQAGG